MPFIGIIAKESDGNFIKNEVLKNLKTRKLEFININKESVQNIKNIKFDAIVINEDIRAFFKSSKYLEKLIENAKYLIVDSDVVKNIKTLENSNSNIITYGLDQKATVTMSSINDENILMCIQNEFKNVEGKIIEEQEVKIEMQKNNLKKVCNSMAIFTILIIFGEILKKI